MFKNVTTLTDFILEEERKVEDATGSFTILLTQLENASKIIASHLQGSGLVDVLGKTGDKNAYGDEVEKLDDYANKLLVDTLLASGQVYAVASEELEAPIYSKDKKGDYIVFFDPLDGSSNIEVNLPLGTIFSIYKKGEGDSIFQKGRMQVASGYILYSTSVVWVYTSGNGVNGFTLDPSIGSFLLTHPSIKIPEEKNQYSINEANYNTFDEKLKGYLDKLKEQKYQLRYVGAMVADIHRTLLKGGIFIYPSSNKRPNGKLRLLFEVNPMSFLIEQAGGSATTGEIDPLEIEPEDVSQTAPIFIGSKNEVGRYLSFIK
ncbi:MAG: class 1 fructose-bisphosphatase [Candidatus Levybacteria bacterium CG10_big_fil_rev_8_21_14_0_10_36_7]|nr:MAG: class 1 fructose-bisphosphatase [Candidatus Levybacteria bacterium CG10_big_fil_rev_8_21_14_0_10_36_7]